MSEPTPQETGPHAHLIQELESALKTNRAVNNAELERSNAEELERNTRILQEANQLTELVNAVKPKLEAFKEELNTLFQSSTLKEYDLLAQTTPEKKERLQEISDYHDSYVTDFAVKMGEHELFFLQFLSGLPMNSHPLIDNNAPLDLDTAETLTLPSRSSFIRENTDVDKKLSVPLILSALTKRINEITSKAPLVEDSLS